MSLDLTTIVLVLLAIWFFGSFIKRMLVGASEMASIEFSELRADQVVRVMHQGVKRTKEIDKLKDKDFLSAEEIIANFSRLSEKERE